MAILLHLIVFNSFVAKLPEIAYCYSAKQFELFSKLLIKMMTIVDFGAYGRQLKSNIVPKELI